MRCLPGGGEVVEFWPGPVDLLVSLPVNRAELYTTVIIATIAIPIPIAILAFTIRLNVRTIKNIIYEAEIKNFNTKFLLSSVPKIGIFLCVLTILGANSVYAEQILTTYRDDGNQTIFDGKWTFMQEWKRTSYNEAAGGLVIRTGHDYNNLYVLLDFIPQHKFSKYSDHGEVCIVANPSKESYPQKDDYCFIITLGSKNPITLQGGSSLGENNYFTKIKNNSDLTAVGGISDSNDRYSEILHTSYEFKIPIEIVGRSDKYGFYAAVYDSNANRVYSWPENATEKNFPDIPSSTNWGELISPDKSLPEFQWPLLVLVSAIFTIIYLTRRKQISFN